MPNLDLARKNDVSSFRKSALGTWRTPSDPQVYGTLELRMDNALRYIADFRARTGRRLTVSHLIAKSAAMALLACPEANAVLRFNRIYLRKRIGVFFQVLINGESEDARKIDLSGATLYDVEKKPLLELCDEFESKVAKVKACQDENLERARKMFLRVPYALLHLWLKIVSFFCFTLNLDLRWAGIPNDPFGSLMVTNVGSLGLDLAYAPLVPYSRVPILLAMGAVKEVPVVEDGRVVAGHVMTLSATFDHRLVDGFHASVMSKVIRGWIEHPYEHFDRLDAGPSRP